MNWAAHRAARQQALRAARARPTPQPALARRLGGAARRRRGSRTGGPATMWRGGGCLNLTAEPVCGTSSADVSHVFSSRSKKRGSGSDILLVSASAASLAHKDPQPPGRAKPFRPAPTHLPSSPSSVGVLSPSPSASSAPSLSSSDDCCHPAALLRPAVDTARLSSSLCSCSTPSSPVLLDPAAIVEPYAAFPSLVKGPAAAAAWQ